MRTNIVLDDQAIVSALTGFGVDQARLRVLNPAPAEQATAKAVNSTLALAPIEAGD